MIRLSSAASVAVVSLLGSTSVEARSSAAGIASLISVAEHNTNTATSLVHHDTLTITNPSVTIHASIVGEEDEVHNRERDSETVTVTGRAKSGQMKTLHYTVDVIFMNGLTYYRTTLAGSKAWKTHSGMAIRDPYTAGFARARTMVTFRKNIVFKELGSSAGETHVHATASTSTTDSSADLWIRTGSRPYIVREDLRSRSLKGSAYSQTQSVLFGPYNQRIIIQSPSSAGST